MVLELQNMFAWMLWTPFLVLALLVVLEQAFPVRLPTHPKLLRMSTNLTIAGCNAVVMNVLFTGVLLTWAERAYGGRPGVLAVANLGLVGTALGSIVLLDLMSYGIHRAYHRLPLLWRFHRAHHSDLDIDATTAVRFHVGEAIMTSAVKAICIPVMGISWAGFVAYEVAFQIVAVWSHSSVRFPESLDRSLRVVFVTPRIHWTHHSRRPNDHHTNFASIFSCWDRLLGTYRLDPGREQIQAGLDAYASLDQTTVVRFWTIPFGRACPGPADAAVPDRG